MKIATVKTCWKALSWSASIGHFTAGIPKGHFSSSGSVFSSPESSRFIPSRAGFRREKDARASLLFGRCFEKALAAFFSGEDSTAVLFKEWAAYQDAQLEYSRGDDWDRMLRQGIRLLERLAQDDRIRIHQPRDNMQVKLVRPLSSDDDFVSYKREVERHLTGKETERWEILYFKAYKSQLPAIEQALETAALMLGSDKSRGYCLEMICADFLAGVSLETGNQDALLLSLTRLVIDLPKPERKQLLETVQVTL